MTKELRDEFSGVRWASVEENEGDCIEFTLRGKQYIGELKGRNAGLVMTPDPDQRAAVALRVLLDGCARQIVAAE